MRSGKTHVLELLKKKWLIRAVENPSVNQVIAEQITRSMASKTQSLLAETAVTHVAEDSTAQPSFAALLEEDSAAQPEPAATPEAEAKFMVQKTVWDLLIHQ